MTMISTRFETYWNYFSFAKTNPAYRNELFQRVFCTACVDAAHIVNSITSPENIESALENPVVFTDSTGVDDILIDEYHLESSHSCTQSQEKIQMFKSIFEEHYSDIESLNPRPVVLENINRMLSCGDPDKGGIMYACPDCQQHVRFSPFHCGSRFCPSCGNRYNIERAAAMECKIIDAPHMHLTFTIPEELRIFMRYDRDTLNDLFAAVSDTLSYIASRISAYEDYEPGFITVLHTFGRDLKWNPHCHVLLCTRVFGNTKGNKNFFLPYPLLRKSFQKCLLDRLKKRFGPIFNRLASLIYKAHPLGFYVHAPKKNVNTQAVIKYIGRYLGRPPIASSRIDNYDGKCVTFHYTRHEDDRQVSETLPVLEFIKKLIVHIPDKFFKMVRYCGFYSSEGAHKAKILKYKLKPKVAPAQKKSIFNSNRWRSSLIRCFGTDPLKCPLCNAIMEPVYFSWKNGTHYYPNFARDFAQRIQLRFLLKNHNLSTA